jgi:glycosyltransferase involved in cell wall biosynthesis
MRVLFATYPWAFETPGGGEMQLLRYEEVLPRMGIEVMRHDPWSRSLGSADLVHFFSCVGGSMHFCRYAKSRGFPLVVSSSLWLTEQSKHLYPLEEIRAQLCVADAVVTNGDSETEHLASVLGLDRTRFYTVRNACDPWFLERVEPHLFREHFAIHGPFVLTVGNIEPRKNQLLLIRAAKAAGRQLVIIGNARSQDYEAACKAESGQDVHYLGPIMNSDPLLRSAYSACEVFCLPSTLETPGLAALEAAAAGARVVVTCEGSTREYFGEYALYVRPGDVDDIRDKIIAAALQPPAPALRQRIAERFTWDHVVGPLAELYLALNRQT